MNPDRLAYTRRQRVALDRPEPYDRAEFHTSDPFKRKVEMVDHAGKRIQMVSALQINLDDWPEWDAWVGFLDNSSTLDGVGDYFLERRMWTEDLKDKAIGALLKMAAMPYEIEKWRHHWETASRPSALHWLWKVTPLERDLITAVQGGGIAPMVKLRDPKRLV